MSETRRQLFKGSVLAAFGAMSATALTACGGGGLHGLFGQGPTDTNVPAVGRGDEKKYWYLFLWDLNRETYQVWRTEQSPPSIPFDTANWYATLEGIQDALTLKTRSVSPPIKINKLVYDTDEQGYLTGISAGNVPAHSSLMRWLEVGLK